MMEDVSFEYLSEGFIFIAAPFIFSSFNKLFHIFKVIN